MQEDKNMAGAPRELGRRTILKGAAWSAPVIAAAVATPLAAASDPDWNASVTSTCTGNLALDAGLAQDVITAIVNAVNLLPGVNVTRAQRYFTITATQGTVPAGTEFVLSSPQALLNASLLTHTSVIGITILGGQSTNTATIRLDQDLQQGQTIRIDMNRALLTVSVASTQTLALNGTDANNSDNSATSSVVAGSSASISVPFVGRFGYTIQACG